MKKLINLLFVFSFLSLIIAYFFGEDSLGGAKQDYLFYEKFIESFAYDFSNTFKSYGIGEYSVRNSPVYYIILSLFVKFGFTLIGIKYINFLSIIFLFHAFYISLNEKYSQISINTSILFLIAILFSPTIRSLLVWPYPFLFALILFLYSIYFYLKFSNSKNELDKFKFALINILFVALSSYFTPNFAIFSLYFFYNYFNFFKLKKLLVIILSNFILALPAIIYYYLTDFYILKSNYPYPNLNLNLSNKIIIISSLLFFYFIPFIRIKELYKNKLNFKLDLKFVFIFLFAIINIIFFDFIKNAGGGIFFHLSYLIFDTPIIIYLIFVLYLYMIKILNFLNLNNLILFFVLIIFNIQYTIYHKYFDPLLLFLFLFLFNFDKKKIDTYIHSISKKYIILYICFLIISLGKSYINY